MLLNLPEAAFSADTAVFVRDRFEVREVQRFDYATIVLWSKTVPLNSRGLAFGSGSPLGSGQWTFEVGQDT